MSVSTIRHKGLTSKEAGRRLLEDGENLLESGGGISPIKIFAGQFRDLMVLILLAATGISTALGETLEALTIVVIVLVNALLGFFQELRTERTLEALSKLAAPNAKVIRDGESVSIPASQVVAGDIMLINAGDRIAADAVLLEQSALFCDESMLTGESHPQEKSVGNSHVEGRGGMVFMGCNVTQGRGVAEVSATGMATEMGAIAGMLGGIETQPTPLQKRLDQVGHAIGWGCLIICSMVAVVGILRGEAPLDMLITGISLAVAAVPEGLPAIVTISLALAVRRILSRNALIKKLHAVETLGCATVICSDKTGTLTQNKMAARHIYTLKKEFPLEESEGGYSLEVRQAAAQEAGLSLLAQTAGYCNDAELITKKQLPFAKGEKQRAQGEPTEQALLLMAHGLGVKVSNFTRTSERPFDSVRKRMSVTGVCSDGVVRTYVKGAPELLLACCGFAVIDREQLPLTSQLRSDIIKKSEQLGSQALRVLGFAYKEVKFGDDSEKKLVFVGLAGLYDPPRPEAARAVADCRKAQIKTVMITGDHAITARAIATQLDILREENNLLTGAQLDTMTEEEIVAACDNTTVFARVTPSHKLRIVKAMKKHGEVVAMTGDGVNDAPALKEADIGVAMGKSGTDVTREAAQVILLDDNFATLVAAIEEGRVIYKNIRRFLRYLLSCNTGEVITMFVGMLMGMPVILTPIQLLLVNLVTDGLPAIALGLEPSDGNAMRDPPRKKDDSIFAGGLMSVIIFKGILIGISTLAVFSIIFSMGGGLVAARTGALTALVMSQLFHVFECRGEPNGKGKPKLFSNPALLLSVVISVIITLVSVYNPGTHEIFATCSLSPIQLAIAILCSGLVPLLGIVAKKFS